MKKINWQVRLKKKSFWVAIVSAVALFVNNITGAFGLDYSASIEQFSDGINGLLAVLVTFGIIVDPTTKGVRDSEKATEYTKPRDDKDPNQYLQWESEGNTFTPTEFDTREEFSDDSDEVEFHQTLLDGGEHPDLVTVEEDEETPEEDTDEGLGQRPTKPSNKVKGVK